jgi:hypothetical protein
MVDRSMRRNMSKNSNPDSVYDDDMDFLLWASELNKELTAFWKHIIKNKN